MKSLIINNRILKYEVLTYIHEYGQYKYTNFYEGENKIEYKKYWLFGPICFKYKPKLIFTLPMNIEDINILRCVIRKEILKQLELINKN